ncbi:MAG TPA: Coenzyme F420 hydrogenase/dehydrogenase, beta subunit C-terminal domain [Dongiaceae bacterium]|nr:Coenzyme F420 hydrogenase/dehydrogenase, beta subunit C-terminal domain [Dongiaceae bacterium]
MKATRAKPATALQPVADAAHAGDVARHGIAGVARLKATVIDGGYCVGCGSCAAVPGSPIRMAMDRFGRLQATIDHADAGMRDIEVTPVCPFSDAAADEDQIAAELFSAPGARRDARIGWSREVWAGHVTEGDFRKEGSSGGMGNWVAAELLRLGEIDAIVHVKPDADGRLFSFAISRTLQELRTGAKSRYYPVEMSAVLRLIRERPGRYALVGVPCFVKAARLQARQDPVIAQRLRFTIALVCGHLKSERFAAMFAWQMGLHPSRMSGFDFRVKSETGRANQYSVRAVGRQRDGTPFDRTRQNKDFFGYLWSHGLFKYRACDYCDDVMGETADITVGDAWLPGFVDDPQGSNVVIARHRRIEEIVRRAIGEGRLSLAPMSIDDAAQSQDAGLRHRRLGLAVRLARAARQKRWAPPKRFRDGRLTRRQSLVYIVREIMAERSHEAFQRALDSGRFEIFARRMIPYMALHDWLNRNRSFRSAVKMLLGNFWAALTRRRGTT